jgi:hypothetical protein
VSMLGTPSAPYLVEPAFVMSKELSIAEVNASLVVYSSSDTVRSIMIFGQRALTMMRVDRISSSMRGSTPGRTLAGANATPLGATTSLRHRTRH